jgi:hypothetical protein
MFRCSYLGTGGCDHADCGGCGDVWEVGARIMSRSPGSVCPDGR